MKSCRFILLLAVVLTSAWAQPAHVAPSTAHDAGSGQRRSELREALRGAPAAEPRQSPGSEAQSVKRQLSAQERADLRRQLRQQVAPGKRERP